MPVPGTSEPSATTSLRERKKARTRAALIEVSQRLFAERGYTATTLEAICAEVEVTVPTLLRYFPSKAVLANAPVSEAVTPLVNRLEDPDRTRSALDSWTRFVAWEAGELANPSSETAQSYLHNLREFGRRTDRDPEVVAAGDAIQRQVQTALATALAADAGAPLGDLHSMLVASLLVQGRLSVYERWLARERVDESIVDDQMAVIDYAVQSLPRRGAGRLESIAD